MQVSGVSNKYAVLVWELLTTADATTANVSTADVLVLWYGLWVRVRG